MRSSADSGGSWDRDPFCSAFLFENRTNEIAVQAKVVPTEQVHDVIEIAWSSSLPHGSDLFSKDLLEGIAARGAGAWKRIGIWMSNASKHRRPNHLLVTRQIQLEARRRRLPRSAVEDSPLNSLAGWSRS